MPKTGEDVKFCGQVDKNVVDDMNIRQSTVHTINSQWNEYFLLFKKSKVRSLNELLSFSKFNGNLLLFRRNNKTLTICVSVSSTLLWSNWIKSQYWQIIQLWMQSKESTLNERRIENLIAHHHSILYSYSA